MYRLVENFIEKNHMIQPEDTVLAGVSGGGDSMAMLDILRRFREKKDFTLQAVHIHHQIREGEADRDCVFVEEMCRKWGIPCRIYTYPVPALSRKWKVGLEEAGRMVRRDAFAQEKKRLGLSDGNMKIALAHNKNDLAETMLHNLARGTGIRGLSAMRPVDGTIIRPVLCWEKKEIVHYLKEEKIPSILDSSNLSDEYTRNRIRHHILPLMEQEINEKAVAHMAAASGFLGEADEYFRKEGHKLLELCKRTEDRIFFEDSFSEKEVLFQKYAVMEAMEILSGKCKDFTAFHVQMLLSLFSMDTGKRISLPYGLSAVRAYGGIVLKKISEEKADREIKELPIPGEVFCSYGEFNTKIFPYDKQKIEEKKYTKWLDYDKIKNKLYIRTRQPGDYLIINREGSRKKLTRVMIDDKIPGEERDLLPLIADGEEILWIAGGRINERYKITSATKRVLELNYKGGIVNE